MITYYCYYQYCYHYHYHLEGQGDLVSGVIRGMTRVTMQAIGVINLLTKSP